MAASDNLLNAAINAIDGTAGSTNYAAFISQHTAAPSAAGSNEYASTTRQACTWNAAATHAKTNSTALTFTNNGATPVTDLGTWTLVSGGTFGIGIHLASSVQAASISAAAGALSVAGAAT